LYESANRHSSASAKDGKCNHSRRRRTEYSIEPVPFILRRWFHHTNSPTTVTVLFLALPTHRFLSPYQYAVFSRRRGCSERTEENWKEAMNKERWMADNFTGDKTNPAISLSIYRFYTSRCRIIKRPHVVQVQVDLQRSLTYCSMAWLTTFHEAKMLLAARVKSIMIGVVVVVVVVVVVATDNNQLVAVFLLPPTFGVLYIFVGVDLYVCAYNTKTFEVFLSRIHFVCGYIFREYRSSSYMKVIETRPRSHEQKQRARKCFGFKRKPRPIMKTT